MGKRRKLPQLHARNEPQVRIHGKLGQNRKRTWENLHDCCGMLFKLQLEDAIRHQRVNILIWDKHTELEWITNRGSG